MKFRFVGVSPDNLASGRPLVFGDVVELSARVQEEPHNDRLIENGALVALPSKSKSAPPSAPDPEEETTT